MDSRYHSKIQDFSQLLIFPDYKLMAVLFQKILANIYSGFDFMASFHLTNPAIICILKNNKIISDIGNIRFADVNDKIGASPQLECWNTGILEKYKMEFIGRENELALLRDWNKKSSRLTVIYGRRRVGKTRLVEEYTKNVTNYKFEGIEGQSKKNQQKAFLSQLSLQCNAPGLRELSPQNWNGLFLLLSNYIGSEPCVIFFDELQWMAGDRNELVSYLKYSWDNFFSSKNIVHLILCGSLSSFMVKNVLKSKALYGRVETEINLRPLFLPAVTGAFGKKRSLREFIELYMVIGGIPQYLKMIDFSKSVLLNLQRLCFSSNGYLVNELDRILISHFGKNTIYRNILIYLANNRWRNREQIQKACRVGSGGRISEYLENLELAGFLERYVSVDKPNGIRNARYRIADPYLLFYFNFIY